MHKLWLLAGCAGSALCLAPPALAEVPGVAALIEQGRYWQGKGRQDLANQAFRRALALDPANAAARQGLSGPARKAAPAKPTPAPKPAAQPVSRPEPTRGATPAPAPTRAAQPAPVAQRGGAARAAGFDALEAGRLAEAERDFQRAIAANSRDADAQGGLGLVRLRQGNFAEARSRLEQASSLGNANQWREALASARFYAGLDDARMALAQNRLPEAQRIAEDLMRSGYADRGPAVELLATIYERQGRYADAADLYRQAKDGAGVAGGRGDVRLAARAARAKAMAAAASGDEMAAEQAFHSGLLLDQKDPWIRLEFARYLLARGRAPEVESLLSSLSGSSDPDWLYAAALLNGEMGRSGAAETLINRIPDGQRTDQMRNFAVGLKVDAAVERARALGGQGRQGEGLAAIRQLAATPGIGAARQASLADALYELGDREGAAALAQQAMGGEISDPAAYEPIVRVLAKTGRDAFAMAAMQRAGELAGPTAQGQQTMARLNGIMAASQADRLRLAGQNAAAFDQLQAAWNAAPGDSEVLAALARLYQSGGMPAQAAQTYQMVLAQTPNDKGALMGLIETAGAAGDRDLARRTIDRAIAQSPDDYEIYIAAARMERARGDEGAAVRYLKRAEALYTRRGAPGMALSSANPFAATQMGDNPFRNQAASVAQAPMANPFALRGGTRLPATSAPIAQDGGYPMSPQPGYGGPGPGGAIPAYGAPAGTSTGGSVFAPPPPSAMSYGGQSYAMQDDAPVGDPVLGRIQSEINELRRDSGPRADLKTGYRERSGEIGLSALKELSGTAEVSTSLGNGRISGKAQAVVLDAGRPSGSGLARFGRNATREAEGIVAEEPSDLVQAQTQHAAGVAVSVAYETPLLKVELGTTPLGFEDTEVTWQAAVTPRFSPHATGRAWFERKPVTDSIVAYAGTQEPVAVAEGRDPVTGLRWGQVMRTGGGVSFSYDRDNAGVYGDFSYNRYAGLNVRNNRSFQVNVGGYLPFMRGPRSSLVGGINVNYQNFANNQNFFTYGHGGYFSPQSFFSVALPVRYSYTDERMEIRANVAPGYQSYSQDQAAIYPTEPGAQAALDALKAQNSDVRSYYDSLSQTGFALSADGSFYYRVSPRTRVGGEIGINTFGNYDEFKSVIGIRQSLGSGQ